MSYFYKNDHNDSISLRLSRFHSNLIRTGSDVRTRCKTIFLRELSIGDHCVIGACALVNPYIAVDMLASGIPARAIQHIEDSQ